MDNTAYRLAAIRETFEESGILLAKSKSSGDILNVEDGERERGRKAIHAGKVSFPDWVEDKGGIPDIGKSNHLSSSNVVPNTHPDNLLPFTRWITPPQMPKRFTTQMYLYFLPLPTFSTTDASLQNIGPLPRGAESIIPVPTHDGGLEHTAARFLPAHKWLDMASTNDIILFPPQVFLLKLVSQFLEPTRQDAYQNIDLVRQRRALEAFVKGGEPTPWADVCISPTFIAPATDGRGVMSLSTPGDEAQKHGRRGVDEYVVLMGRGKGGAPANVEIRLRSELKDLFDKKAKI